MTVRHPTDRPAPLEALVVDYGGVLTSPLQEAMAAYADELGIELQDLVRAALGAYSGEGDALVTDFETGRISEEEFATAFATRLQEISGRPVAPDNLVGKLFRLRLEEEMLDVVRRVRAAGNKTALLSNSWGTRLYPRDRLDPLFDVVVISGEVGLRKPERAIFELTSEKLDVRPERCLFVDDHPGHLEAALEYGMATVLHRSPAETVKELESLFALSVG